jgi:D-xylose transport system substrate-binding protein
MKKVAGIVLIVLMTLLLVLGCKGKSAAPAAGSVSSKDTIVVGISLPTQREEIWVRHEKNIREAALALGATVLTQISDNEAARQQSQCENLLAQGIDVLVLGAHDAVSAGTIVNMAHAEGVPVVSYDRLILDCDVDVYVSFDNVAVGECMGQWFIENIPPGNIVVLAGDPLDNNAKLFRQGAINKIQPKINDGTYKVVMDQNILDWRAENAMSLAENVLTANNNNITGFVAPNDSTAGGIIQALAAQGLDGKVLTTGQDFEVTALQRVYQGTQGMSVFKDTVIEGAAAAKAAIELAKKQPVADLNGVTNNGFKDVPSVLATPQAVTKSNLQQIVQTSGLYAWADITR